MNNTIDYLKLLHRWIRRGSDKRGDLTCDNLCKPWRPLQLKSYIDHNTTTDLHEVGPLISTELVTRYRDNNPHESNNDRNLVHY